MWTKDILFLMGLLFFYQIISEVTSVDEDSSCDTSQQPVNLYHSSLVYISRKIQTCENISENCVLHVVGELLDESKNLNSATLPTFVEKLKTVSVNNNKTIIGSPGTINAMVDVLSNVANAITLSEQLNKDTMTNILETVGILTSDSAKTSWDSLNEGGGSGGKNSTMKKKTSSLLLHVFETITDHLEDASFSITTPFILLNKTSFTTDFHNDFNSSVDVEIQKSNSTNQTITVIMFASMDNVLPPRDESNSSVNVINGKVVLIKLKAEVKELRMIFDVRDRSLGNPECLFWDFNLFDSLGGWSKKGCSLKSYNNKTVECVCYHTTSFSILMSPVNHNETLVNDLTYIGVGISIGSLLICLITEVIVWKKISINTTSYLRHVSIVNIAVSLLIANVWFIIGGALTDSERRSPLPCIAATFFIHFFYLAMFFWMLASALLLLYRTVKVFEGGLSKVSMMAIGFSLGYGAPLVIAATTIAVTLPSNGYIRENVCWLNWESSKALLAFLIPALSIVAVNLLILFVVIHKMLQQRVVKNAAEESERSILVVITRSLAVLTPFFGLTWSLGIGTMVSPDNNLIHFAFSLFNSLQGVFIWVSGTLFDKKVRLETIKSLSSQDASIG